MASPFCYVKWRWEKGHNMNILWWMSRLFIFIYSCHIKNYKIKCQRVKFKKKNFCTWHLFQIKEKLKGRSEMNCEGVTVLMDNLKWIFSLTHVLKVRSSYRDNLRVKSHVKFFQTIFFENFSLQSFQKKIRIQLVTFFTNEPQNSQKSP